MGRCGRAGMSGRWLFNSISIAIGLVLFAVWGYPLRQRAWSGENDFLQLYAGARLVGTPELYDVEASKRIHREVTAGHTYYPSVYYTRLPYYALWLSPLGKLPYRTAYWIYQAISLVVLAAFLIAYTRRWPETPVLAALSVPLLVNFVNGQDSGLAAALAGFAVLAARGGREFFAGVLLSLCSIKVHLFLLVPLVVLLHRRWAILSGAVIGGSGLMAWSILADGFGWPGRFLNAVRNPELHPGPEHMTTFRNLANYLSGGDNSTLELAMSLATAALVAYLVWRIRNFEVAFGVALAGGLLVCHHAYTQDLLLLFLAALLFATAPASGVLRGVSVTAALPPTAFLLLSDHPWSALVPLLLLSVLLAAFADVSHRPASPATGNHAA